MTTLTRAAAALLLTASLAACGGGSSSDTAAADLPTAAAEGVDLFGFVGTEEDPEAYEIGLLDAQGQPVESVPAGEYTLQLVDRAQTHNFALKGAGVDVQTSVGDVEQETLTVTLSAGTYTYVCTPHPSMSGTLRVT